MLDHFFVSSTDGALHDTRDPNWSRKPLRENFRRSFPEIRNTAQFKATLRAGAYAWLGGYPLHFVCSDGASLCFACGRKKARNILQSIRWKSRDGWRVVACDINWEDGELYCDHCSGKIESAYGD